MKPNPNNYLQAYPFLSYGVSKTNSLWNQLKALESIILIAIVLIAGGLWGFIEITDEVLEGETHAVDEMIILSLRNPADLNDPIGPSWVEEAMRDFTAMGGVGVLTFLTLATAGYQFLSNRPKAGWLIIVTVVSGTLLSLLLKTGFDRPRPDLVSHGSYVATASFPSGHSMLSAITYFTLGALWARLESKSRIRIYILLFAVLLVGLIGFSRIYLGVHWPTDVLAGWMAGAAWASACWLIAWWMQREGHVEQATNIE